MGIRDLSYYGWENVLSDSILTSSFVITASLYDVVVDQSGNYYSVGQLRGRPTTKFDKGDLNDSAEGSKALVYKRTVNSSSWFEIADREFIDTEVPTGLGPSDPSYYGFRNVAVSSTGKLFAQAYITNNSIGILTSSDGVTWHLAHYIASGGANIIVPSSIEMSGANCIFSYNYNGPGGNIWKVISSSYESHAGSWSESDSLTGRVYQLLSSGSYLFGVGWNGASNSLVRRLPSTGSSPTWTTVDTFASASDSSRCYGITINNSTGEIYVGGTNFIGTSFSAFVRKSSDQGDTWTTVLSQSNEAIYGIASDSVGNIYTLVSSSDDYHVHLRLSTDQGASWNKITAFSGSERFIVNKFKIINDTLFLVGNIGKKTTIRTGNLTANSASLGPRMLNFSFGYVEAELSGNINEKFKLNNISEFPHYGGLFQMPNLVLGTTDSGKIGTNEDAIIQVNYFGSVVKIMWPKQSNQDIAVIGFGDLSAGQRPGKLTTNFESGEFIDVTKFDHMTLYCYLTKEISGTLDNIDIKIERRPLKSTGFAVEQSIEYSSSGSDTIAELKDIIYRKQVDYGDLTLREVAYPIDIPLTNVREIRISARQLTGQSDDKNKNFIVWGRFISSEKET